jgi:hypothetical protein
MPEGGVRMVRARYVLSALLLSGALSGVSLAVSAVPAAGASRTVVAVSFPSSGGPTVVNCGNAPYLASGSGEAVVRVNSRHDGGWRVTARLTPGNLALVHPTGATFSASGRAVDREQLLAGDTQADMELPLTFVGPDTFPALDVVFVLRVVVDANGQPTATVIGATCAPSGG